MACFYSNVSKMSMGLAILIKMNEVSILANGVRGKATHLSTYTLGTFHWLVKNDAVDAEGIVYCS